jgi:MuDR family transposase
MTNFANKNTLSRALEEWHTSSTFVQMKVKKSDTNLYTYVCVENNCRWRLHAHEPKGATYFFFREKGSYILFVEPIQWIS